MPKVAYIYCLIDPDTDEVRYIGKANNVKVRYQQHCGVNSGRFPVQKWIAKLAKEGKRPIIASLSRVLQEDWKRAEMLFIEKYRRTSKKLLNATDGGDATKNPHEMTGKRGELSRLKWRLSRSLHDKYFSEEGKESLRAKMREMYAKNPQEFSCWRNI